MVDDSYDRHGPLFSGTSNYWSCGSSIIARLGHTERISAASPIRSISTSMTERGWWRENRWTLHAPFRRVMKRLASDMMRESNCAYTRGRSRRPDVSLSSCLRLVFLGAMPHF